MKWIIMPLITFIVGFACVKNSESATQILSSSVAGDDRTSIYAIATGTAAEQEKIHHCLDELIAIGMKPHLQKFANAGGKIELTILSQADSLLEGGDYQRKIKRIRLRVLPSPDETWMGNAATLMEEIYHFLQFERQSPSADQIVAYISSPFYTDDAFSYLEMHAKSHVAVRLARDTSNMLQEGKRHYAAEAAKYAEMQANAPIEETDLALREKLVHGYAIRNVIMSMFYTDIDLGYRWIAQTQYPSTSSLAGLMGGLLTLPDDGKTKEGLYSLAIDRFYADILKKKGSQETWKDYFMRQDQQLFNQLIAKLHRDLDIGEAWSDTSLEWLQHNLLVDLQGHFKKVVELKSEVTPAVRLMIENLVAAEENSLKLYNQWVTCLDASGFEVVSIVTEVSPETVGVLAKFDKAKCSA